MDRENPSDREKHKIEINTPDPGYEPFPVSIMNRSTYEAVNFDPRVDEPARISYRLNKAGCVRIRIARRGRPGLLLRTLQDWTDQEFGHYELKWDGRDSSGNIVDNRKIIILFEAKDQGKGLWHADHEAGRCSDPVISISAPAASGGKAAGVIDLVIALPDEYLKSGESDRGREARCYVDYALHSTTKYDAGSKEFIVGLDTNSLAEGEHYVVVNLDDGRDHIGSAGLFINVEK